MRSSQVPTPSGKVPLAGLRWGLLQPLVGSFHLPPHLEMEDKFASKFQGGCCFSMPSMQCCWAAPRAPGQGQSRQVCQRALGANWVPGKCMAYQVPSRGQIGQWGRHSVWLPCPLPAPLDFGGHHKWVFLPHLLCRGRSKRGASYSACLVSQCPRGQREASSLAGTQRCPSPRLCPQDQAWPAQPPGPPLVAPKASGGWSSAGWQA